MREKGVAAVFGSGSVVAEMVATVRQLCPVTRRREPFVDALVSGTINGDTARGVATDPLHR